MTNNDDNQPQEPSQPPQPPQWGQPAPGQQPPQPGAAQPPQPGAAQPPQPGQPQPGAYPPPPPAPGPNPQQGGYTPPPPPPGGMPGPGGPGPMGPGQPGGNAQWGGAAGLPPQGFTGQFDLGSAHSAAWKAFGKAWLPLCGIGLIVFLAVALFLGSLFADIYAIVQDEATGGDPTQLNKELEDSVGFSVPLLLAAIASPLCQIVATTTSRQLQETGTGRLSFKNFGGVFLVVIAISVVSLLISQVPVLSLFGSLALGFFTIFAAPAAAHGVGFVDAFKESYKIATSNVGSVILLLLTIAGYSIAAIIPCFLGIIVIFPFAYLLSVTAYRQVKGLPIAQ